MADQNQGLPLIISEILIEMHEMKDEVRAMQGDIRSMTEALNRTVSVISRQQDHTNNILMVFQEEGKKNAEFMTYSIIKALGQQQAIN